MKKFLFLSLIFSAILSISTQAQQPDPAAMLQQMKERTVPAMVKATGLTEAQATKVVELNFEMRMAASKLPQGDDRSAKIGELRAAKEKKMAELFTADQLKAIATFYEDMAKNAPPRQ
jgi:dsRNA-specific ribonuclease